MAEASCLHGDQKYAGYPYVLHLRATWSVGLRHLESNWHADDHTRIVAGLCFHDVLEDTTHTYEDLRKVLGPYFPKGVVLIPGAAPGTDLNEVLEDIWAVTGFGRNRKERLACALAKIQDRPHAQYVKLCDRLANMTFSFLMYEPGGMFDVYRREYKEFRAHLYSDGGRFADLWAELDTLSTMAPPTHKLLG